VVPLVQSRKKMGSGRGRQSTCKPVRLKKGMESPSIMFGGVSAIEPDRTAPWKADCTARIDFRGSLGKEQTSPSRTHKDKQTQEQTRV